MTASARERCRRYRLRILEIARQVPAAHVAPAFSCVEIVDALYNEVMRPHDVFIMSKGHGWLAQLVVLEERGHVTRDMVDAFCKTGGVLGGHPDYWPQIGIHASTGSLGHGLGIAAGQAYAEKLRGSDVRVFVLLSDGECQEGSTWEAVMLAANLGLDNLVAIVDDNDYGGMDRISEHQPWSAPTAAQFRAFGWFAFQLNGHDDVAGNVRPSVELTGGHHSPTVFLAHTVKGRGASFMQDAPIWHYRSPDDAEYAQAVAELTEESI